MLGQRRRRRSHDAAGRRVSQGFQGDKGAGDTLRVAAGGAVGVRPRFPELLRLPQSTFRIGRLRNGKMGCDVHHDERYGLPGRDREVADGRQAFATKLDGSAQDKHVGTGNGQNIAIVGASHPWHRGPVIETDGELGAHADAAAFPDHQPHHMRGTLARRHEVDHDGFALRSGELGFQNQRVRAVMPRNPHVFRDRCDPPQSIVRSPQKRRETRTGIETRPAEPIDRAVPAHERGRLAITDERIILDLGGSL